ncbi:MAG: endolytic transglycosylase MltG [Clostridia bacterium]
MKAIKRVFIKTILVIVAIVVIFSAVRVTANILKEEKTIYIEIPSGYNPRQIANLLKSNDIIDSAFYFRSLLKVSPDSSNLKAGLYEFSSKESTLKIISKLVNGEVAVYEDVRITIPEGRNIEQIGEIFEREGLFSLEEFLEAVNEYHLEYEWVEDIPNDRIEYKYEGYLFPDTYDFKSIATPEMVIDKLAARFNQQVYNLYKESDNDSDLSFHELVTLASIVEKEAVLTEERPIIASIFFNRLDTSLALQSCATVQYVLEEHKEVLSTKDTQIESPFNTYRYPGLPPGPISSIGQSSFKAVLDPADTNYKYFHAIGGGKHSFSVTFQEHQESIRNNR